MHVMHQLSHSTPHLHICTLTLSSVLFLSHTPAPSAPPASLSSSNVVPKSFTIQWGKVLCIHQNGDITGYSVLYGMKENETKQSVMIFGSDNQTTTLNGLDPDTAYLVQVAGINAQGVGDYCNLTVFTPQSGFDAHTRVRKHTQHTNRHTEFFQPHSLKIPIILLHSCVSQLWWHKPTL